MVKKLLQLSSLFILLLAISCGGSGGSTAGSVGIRAFAVDDLNTGYDHVWVSIKKIDLVSAAGEVNIFDETASGGRQIDLRTLRDSSGARFLLLGTSGVPAGTYTRAKVTVDKNVGIVVSGATTVTNAVFAGASATDKVFNLDFDYDIDPSRIPDVVLDFDLKDWTLSGSTVVANADKFLKHHDRSGIENENRHEVDDFSGAITALTGTAPTQTFTLTKRGRTIRVTTNSDTAIFNNDGSPNPVLNEGVKVEVLGLFSPSTNSIVAKRIKVEVADEENDEASVEGRVTALSASAGTLDVSIYRANGFRVEKTTQSVASSANTKYFLGRGRAVTKDLFFAALVLEQSRIEVEGTLDGAKVLVAKRMKLEGGEGGSNSGSSELEIKGLVQNLNVEEKTFSVKVERWEGISLERGAVVRVKANRLPERMANAVKIEVEGTFDPLTQTVLATKVALDD